MNYGMLMSRAYCSSVEVLNLTASLCRDAINNNIPGDFCECGTAYGVHGVVMNDVAKGSGKSVWLCDSFEGISLHGPEDKEWTEAHGARDKADPRKSGGITVCSMDQVEETIRIAGQNPRDFIFIKGWFADTLPSLEKGVMSFTQFSVLRLDVDLYDPYMTCFEYMLPRLSPNGWLIIDDIVLSGCQQAVVDSGLNMEDFTIDKNKMAYLHWTPFKISRWKQNKKIKSGNYITHSK